MTDGLRMPGGTYRVVRGPADPAVDPVEMVWTLGPRSFSPPPHVHPSQTEAYEVLEGSLRVRIGETMRTLVPGEVVVVPAGVVHTFRNPRGVRTVVRNVHDPALGFADFVRAMDGALHRPWWDPRRTLGMATAWAAHPETLRATRPHERALFAVTRVFARGR